MGGGADDGADGAAGREDARQPRDVVASDGAQGRLVGREGLEVGLQLLGRGLGRFRNPPGM